MIRNKMYKTETKVTKDPRTGKELKVSKYKPAPYPKARTDEGLDQDWQWYADDARDLMDMANIPFVGTLGGYTRFNPLTSFTTAGILRFNYAHSFGKQDEDSDACSKAGRQLFTRVSRAFAGFANVEFADIWCAVFAQITLVEWIHMAKRVYSTIGIQSKWNKYKGVSLTTALGFRYRESSFGKGVGDEITEFRAQINKRIKKFNEFCVVPDGIPAFDRAEYYTSQIFTDVANTAKQNFIVYQPNDYILFNGTMMNTGSALTVKKYPDGWKGEFGISVEQFLAVFDECYDRLANDQDVQNIYQVLERVYDSDKLIKFSPLEEEREFVVVHSDIAMNIYHNALALGEMHYAIPNEYLIDKVPGLPEDSRNIIAPLGFLGNSFFQELPLVWQSEKGKLNAEMLVLKGNLDRDGLLYPGPNVDQVQILDVITVDHPDAAAVIDTTSQMAIPEYRITRAKALMTSIGVDNSTVQATEAYDVCCRDSVITSFEVFKVNAVGNMTVTSFTHCNAQKDKDLAITQFNFHPFIPVSNSAQIIGEMINFTYISRQTLVNMHELAQYKLFSIPVAQKDIIK